MAGSIINGYNPLSDPLALFLLQILIIIVITRLLGALLARFRQPRVIAEVIGGILLGPSAFGRIPGFTDSIFPKSSMETLSNVASLGLILYLFVVGMELDLTSMRKQFKNSVFISAAGILLPFGLGAAVSVGLYNELLSEPRPKFSSFVIFIGVAISITAFPVLARILTELKLLSTKVGISTIGAAAVDDAVAWCLLALVMALINNTGDPINALYVFLVVVGYTIFCLVVVRPLLGKLIKYSENKDSVSHYMVFLMFVMVLASSWFTEVIGVHAIFGAFIIGIITPNESDFAIKLTESIEDVVSVLLLPLYFAYSGLSTDVTKMNSGLVWGFFFLVLVVACGGKIVGCTGAAKLNGHSWRDSLSIGLLMNCKGLVELIVLNLGLSAGVINVQIFTLMVLMAIATTLMTVPLVSLVYKPARDTLKGGKDSQSNLCLSRLPKMQPGSQFNILVTVQCVQSISGCISIIQLLQDHNAYSFHLHALRLLELSNRESTVMRAAKLRESVKYDPVIHIFRIFGQLCHFDVSGHLVVAHSSDFASNIAQSAVDTNTNFMLVPWIPPSTDDAVEKTEINALTTASTMSYLSGSMNGGRSKNDMLEEVLRISPCSVGIFIDRGFGADMEDSSREDSLEFPDRKRRIILPFVGGADDREALCLLMFICTKNPDFDITVIRLQVTASEEQSSSTTNDVSSGDEIVSEPAGAAVRGVYVRRNTTEMTQILDGSDTRGSSARTLTAETKSVLSARSGGKVAGSVIDFELEDDEKVLAKFKERMAGHSAQYEEIFADDLVTACVNKILATCGKRDLVLLGHAWYESAQTLGGGIFAFPKPSFSLLAGNAGPSSTGKSFPGALNSPHISALENSLEKHNFRKFIDSSCVCSALIVRKHSENSMSSVL